MARACRTCPFSMTEEADRMNNSGCLPSPGEIIQMKVDTGNNWACHSNCNRVCQGLVNESKWWKSAVDLDFTKGKLIHDFESVHSKAEYTGGFPKEIAHWGSCETCEHRVEVHSHPWYDGKPASNVIGYGCAVALVMPGEKKFVSMLRPGSIGCELHEDYDDDKTTQEETSGADSQPAATPAGTPPLL